MPSLQRIGSLLCFFALLFSNVAGFVHRGCTQTSSNTLHAYQHLADADDGHYHHHCGHSHSRSVSDDANETSSSYHSRPLGPDHSEQHDEDSCNVCHSLYTNEDGFIEAESRDSFIELTQTERGHLFNEIVWGEFLLGLNLLRGPPQV